MSNENTIRFCKVVDVDGRQFLVFIEDIPGSELSKVRHIFYSNGEMFTLIKEIRFANPVNRDMYLDHFGEVRAKLFIKEFENPDVIYNADTGEVESVCR